MRLEFGFYKARLVRGTLRAYIENWNFIDAFVLGITLCCKVFVDIFEVRYGHIFFEVLIQHDIVVDELYLGRGRSYRRLRISTFLWFRLSFCTLFNHYDITLLLNHLQ